ncbi:MAG: hypothetical protein RMJ89_11475, partial [Flammeovirgaceae bacterium]|nr:hypothetical protein [Flammeovirgaceae bacterium]
DEYFPEGTSSDFPFSNSSVGIQYQHAFLCAFDEQGVFQWDFSYTFDETEHHYPLVVVKAFIKKDVVTFLESRREDFRCQVGSLKSNDLQEVTTVALEPIVEKENIIDVYLGGMRYWYEHHFVVTGIRQYYSANRKEKKVYFISKVSVK